MSECGIVVDVRTVARQGSFYTETARDHSSFSLAITISGDCNVGPTGTVSVIRGFCAVLLHQNNNNKLVKLHHARGPRNTTMPLFGWR